MKFNMEKDIELIDQKIEELKDAGKCSPYQPEATKMAIAELLKAKALLIIALDNLKDVGFKHVHIDADKE